MSLSLPSKLFDEIAFEEAHYSKAPHAFFCAWQRGAELAGADYFGKGTEQTLKVAIDKWELRPNMPYIAKAMRFMSPGQRMFIAAMTSIYNSHDGGKLLRRAGFEGLSDFGGLDLERRKVIAALVLNYHGF
jgi:hypothetical protein